MDNKFVCELVWKTATSQKGTVYEALFAVLPNGKEILISFDKKMYFILNKYSK